MNFPTEWKNKEKINHTTNQYIHIYVITVYIAPGKKCSKPFPSEWKNMEK